ncbi:hypothetical protein [Bradyrhizobium sp.]|uniref:hypothetical protein n=1 Tax=Bradyrhizobium sp. TaxID=376 RepID=UPI003C78929B
MDLIVNQLFNLRPDKNHRFISGVNLNYFLTSIVKATEDGPVHPHARRCQRVAREPGESRSFVIPGRAFIYRLAESRRSTTKSGSTDMANPAHERESHLIP